jgi:hypothetical protein
MLLASTYDKSKYWRGEDLDRERKFRIKDVTEDEIGEKKEKKLVVWFTNDERGLVLNRTNNRVLRAAFGDDTAGWKNKIIVIFVIMVDNRGKMVPGLRVRIPPPKQSAGGAAAPSSGNGAAAAPPVAAVQDDPELEPDPVKPLKEELDDEINF